MEEVAVETLQAECSGAGTTEMTTSWTVDVLKVVPVFLKDTELKI